MNILGLRLLMDCMKMWHYFSITIFVMFVNHYSSMHLIFALFSNFVVLTMNVLFDFVG